MTKPRPVDPAQGLIVNTVAFRRALQAVVPHADPDPEMAPFHRVTLHLASDLEVSATQRYSAGLATVPVMENAAGLALEAGITPATARDILAIYKVPKELEADAALSIMVDAGDLVVTDVSGMIPGRQFRTALAPFSDAVPDVPRIIGRHVEHPHRAVSAIDLDLIIGAAWWAAFVPAARAYAASLYVTAVRSGTDRVALLVTVGDAFIGLLTAALPASHDSALADELTATRRAWARTLPHGRDAADDDLDPAQKRLLRVIHDTDEENHDDAE